jgi:hypothetical protein
VQVDLVDLSQRPAAGDRGAGPVGIPFRLVRNLPAGAEQVRGLVIVAGPDRLLEGDQVRPEGAQALDQHPPAPRRQAADRRADDAERQRPQHQQDQGPPGRVAEVGAQADPAVRVDEQPADLPVPARRLGQPGEDDQRHAQDGRPRAGPEPARNDRPATPAAADPARTTSSGT